MNIFSSGILKLLSCVKSFWKELLCSIFDGWSPTCYMFSVINATCSLIASACSLLWILSWILFGWNVHSSSSFSLYFFIKSFLRFFLSSWRLYSFSILVPTDWVPEETADLTDAYLADVIVTFDYALNYFMANLTDLRAMLGLNVHSLNSLILFDSSYFLKFL